MGFMHVSDIEAVQTLKVAGNDLVLELENNKTLVSVDHFTDRTPVRIQAVTDRRGRFNGGLEGEKAVKALFRANGITNSKFFPSRIVRTDTGNLELWDLAFQIDNTLVIVEVKTRLIEGTSKNRQHAWVKENAMKAHGQFCRSRDVIKSYYKNKIIVPNLNGGKKYFDFDKVNVRYLNIIAVNELRPGMPRELHTTFPANLPSPGLSITLKELKDMFTLLGAKETFKYITQPYPSPVQNIGFELVRYAHKLNIPNDSTYVFR